ncbi:MAG: hypothetical protein ACTHL6_18145 [Arthrobacter sp.]
MARQPRPEGVEEGVTVAEATVKQEQWNTRTTPVFHPRRVPVNVEEAGHVRVLPFRIDRC